MPILVATQEIVRELVFCIPHDIDLQNENQIKHYEVIGDILYIHFDVDEQRESIEITYTTSFGSEEEFDTKKTELVENNEWADCDFSQEVDEFTEFLKNGDD
jgi:hypothetical protein